MRFFQPLIYSLFFILILFTLSCIHTDDFEYEEMIFDINTSEDKLRSYYKSNSICSQLSTFLGPGDSFELNSSLDSLNALTFESVHDSIIYRNDHWMYLDLEVLNTNNGTHTTRFRLLMNKTSSIDFMVSQLLDHEDIMQVYSIKNIRSDFHGYNNGISWQQTGYSYDLFNGTAIIDLFGVITYQMLITDIPIDFIDLKQYKMIIDVHTGIPLSFLDVYEFE